jgi:hypothetical protein
VDNNAPSSFPERLRRVFQPNPRGVIGVADELLALCREQRLQLHWHAGYCRFQTLGAEPLACIEFPIQRSVFRSILARLAALCNEQSPDFVSPYGGEGQLTVCDNPLLVVRVIFTNTPDVQRLELNCPERSEPARGSVADEQIEPEHPPVVR